ncbi:MAG: TadE/TadG family type IV pilus assembly protein [Dehalococcoidia bacterium]
MARSERGQGLVEFAVILPLFFIFLFVIIDAGLLLARYNNETNAAKEGARLGAVGASSAEIRARVVAQAHGFLDGATDCAAPPVTTDICVEWIPGPGGSPAPGQVGSSVRVTVHYRYKLSTPLLNGNILGMSIFGLGDGLDTSECAVQRLERPVANPGRTSSATKC